MAFTSISYIMETADSMARLKCPSCRNIYTDPVSLNCGHSFCRPCIDHVVDQYLVFGYYCCGQCQKKFKDPPLLQASTKILQVLQSYNAIRGRKHGEEEVKVYCLYCTESQVPAVKTCVQCETPLCDQHLQAHNKELNHILIPPTNAALLTYRKCSDHDNTLQYYCSQHAACVCASCCLTDNHQGHDIMSVKEAFDIENNKLQNYYYKLRMREERIANRMRCLAYERDKASEDAKALIIKINDFFKEARDQINRLHRTVKKSLYEEMQKISAPKLRRHLYKRKERLSRKIRSVEKLCDMTDPVAFLQKVESDKELLHDDPDEETEQNEDQIHSIENIVIASLHSGLSELMEEVCEHFGSNASQES